MAPLFCESASSTSANKVEMKAESEVATKAQISSGNWSRFFSTKPSMEYATLAAKCATPNAAVAFFSSCGDELRCAIGVKRPALPGPGTAPRANLRLHTHRCIDT